MPARPLAPEHIHPALWRGSQLARAGRPCAAPGHAVLQAVLPGGGWPLGSLVELLLPRPGIGEIRLLRPALAGLAATGPVALLQPPHPPQVACWAHWQLDPARLLWLQPEHDADAMWAAEQILRNGSCAALLYWAGQLRPATLRRLHLAAQCGQTLFFLLRPASAAGQPSPAPLRLALAPAQAGLAVSVLKRRGPALAGPLHLPLDGAPLADIPLPHAPVDRPAPAPAQPGRLAPALAG